MSQAENQENTMRNMKIKRYLSLILFLLAALPFLSGCARATWLPLWTAPPPGSTPHLQADQAGETQPTSTAEELFSTDAESMAHPRIVVTKSAHVLELYDGDTLMARLRVALGRSEGAKAKSGDGKTPEGAYFICSTTDTGKYFKSLFFNYPNSDDAYAGLNDRRISQEQYDAIVDASDRREIPPWDTPLGGEIAVSGTGTAGQGKSGDWTAGNIALSDKDMEYLWKYAAAGVDVVINP
jgi:hypothetical protein